MCKLHFVIFKAQADVFYVVYSISHILQIVFYPRIVYIFTTVLQSDISPAAAHLIDRGLYFEYYNLTSQEDYYLRDKSESQF